MDFFSGEPVQKYRVSAADHHWISAVDQYPECLSRQLPNNLVRQENSVESIALQRLDNIVNAKQLEAFRPTLGIPNRCVRLLNGSLDRKGTL